MSNETSPPTAPDLAGPAAPRHAGLEALLCYPLVSALTERRTRRIARGVSLEAGGLSYSSPNQPEPLGPLEEAILIVSLGVTGVVTHDGPLLVPGGGQELGTPFLNVSARTASSADNCQATSLFMINDAGIWLLRAPRGRDALKQLAELPPRWDRWREEDWIAAAAAAKVKVSDRRLSFPREYPYYLGWNKQISNVPGSTVFLPVVDCTRQYINALLILASEPDGKRPLFVDDWRKFHPSGLVEWLAWLGGKLGLSEHIPYQPIGGLKWIRNGFVNKENVGPLGFGHGLRTDYEAFFYLQNLMLVGQALGVGGWVHGSVFPPYIYLRDEAKGWHGLGFRMATPKAISPTPPVPASQPNPVGIDGVLEALCPPYVGSMNEAVDRVIEEKYGPTGTYGDVDTFARPYRARSSAEEYLRLGTHYTANAISYTKDICNYLYDTYGRFPAHVDAIYCPGIWVQFSHLEMEYYRQFYVPDQYTRQAEHDAVWHGRR
jgi:hypothetical protein